LGGTPLRTGQNGTRETADLYVSGLHAILREATGLGLHCVAQDGKVASVVKLQAVSRPNTSLLVWTISKPFLPGTESRRRARLRRSWTLDRREITECRSRRLRVWFCLFPRAIGVRSKVISQSEIGRPKRARGYCVPRRGKGTAPLFPAPVFPQWSLASLCSGRRRRSSAFIGG